MPKAAPDVNYLHEPGQDDIGFPRKITAVEPKPIAQSMDNPTDN
jgi:hypothetical protein